ncbi:MAG: lysophospholipid acyltransferase family protein [Candidatus Zixiibacteriota bacterium]
MKEKIYAFIIRSLLRCIGFTWRVKFELSHLPLNKRFIYIFWHRYILPLAYLYRNQDIGIIVSESKDGEIISQVILKMGYTPIRGSSSRGGSKALRKSVKFLRNDGVLAITPDGPRGPLYKAQKGFEIAAKMAKVKIVPICVEAKPAWRLKTWDKMLIPMPFAKITVRSKQPIDGSAESVYQDVSDALMGLEKWEDEIE